MDKKYDGRTLLSTCANHYHVKKLTVEFPKDKNYWNINTAGIFKSSYGKNREEVYNRHTTAKQSVETVETSQDNEQSGTQIPSSMDNVSTTSSEGKDTKKSGTPNKNEINKPENEDIFAEAERISKEVKKNSALDNTMDTGKTPKGNGNDTATPESTVSESTDNKSSDTKQEKGDLFSQIMDEAEKRKYLNPVISKVEGEKTGDVKNLTRRVPTDKEKSKSAIREVVDLSQRIKDKVKRKIISAVSKKQIDDLRKNGIDVDGEWVHSIENSSVIHNRKNHGNEEKENKKDQMAVVPSDYELIPDILENYDSVEKSDRNNSKGLPVIVYKKEYPNGNVYYLEEVRDKRKSLAFNTMYKKKSNNPDGLLKKSTPSTSETTSGNLALPESKDNKSSDTKQEKGDLFSQILDEAERRKYLNPVIFKGDGEKEPGGIGAADKIAAAEKDVDTNPTEAQQEAGNYKKGHVKIDGYDVTIENPKGSVRSGRDSDGEEWHTEMKNTYGYIRGTEGVDGDHIDVYLSDDPTNGNVYVVDQVNPKTGEFDEHKVMYGFPDAESAKEAYLSNYEKDWKGLGNITEVSKDEFKKWIDSSHRKTKPFAEYKSVKTLEESYKDNQGNPVDKNGKLITEKVTNIDDMKDEDFTKPTRSIELPKIPENVNDAIGAENKPVVIKKNVFEKNEEHHHFSPSESRRILQSALYDTDLVGQTQPIKRKNHWVAIKVDEKSPITVLEVKDSKDNVEVVGWYTLDERNLDRIKRQALREGGELLILTSKKDAAESLSTLPQDLYGSKDNKSSDTKQGKGDLFSQIMDEAERRKSLSPALPRREKIGKNSGKSHYTLSEKLSDNGEPFYQDADGKIDLVEISNEILAHAQKSVAELPHA